jgi:homoserine dehydrogenase
VKPSSAKGIMIKPLRLALFGFGTVGQWLAGALYTRRAWLQQEFGLGVSIIAVATAHYGLIYRSEGLDIPTLLDLVAIRQPLTAHPSVTHWTNVLEGLQSISCDLLAEATGATLTNGEPGLSYIRTALAQGMHVVTSSKGPLALAGLELLSLARAQGVQLRMESTVMSGTPVLSTIREGMAGTRIRAIRGILNGTANFILSDMARGSDYAEALAQAQTLGYAEADPADDVEGDDAVAKTLILAAVAFGRALAPSQVVRQGITTLTREQVQQANAQAKRIKHVASLRLLSLDGAEVSRETADNGIIPIRLEARVEPLALPLSDPLARIDGLLNAIAIQTDTEASVMVVGPGAGLFQAGQGMLADLIAIAKTL